MAKFEKLTKPYDIEKFHELFCKKIDYEIPLTYFKKGSCYGMFVKKVEKTGFGDLAWHDLVGGFCLVHDIPSKLRSIKQIPLEEPLKELPTSKTAEFTGYFLLDKKHGLYFTLNLVRVILGHKAKKFVYSYPVSQKRLGKYYSYGNPDKLYTGVPRRLTGHSENMEAEHVEALTKWGIVKIFLARTYRYLTR